MTRPEEMSFPEIASALGISLTEVQIAYATGIRKLRKVGQYRKPAQALQSLARQLHAERERREVREVA